MRTFLGPYELTEEEEKVLEKALRLLASRMPIVGWQPPETAPKDRTPILAYLGRDFIEIAYWLDGDWWIEAHDPPRWGKDIVAWMPLPEPPK